MNRQRLIAVAAMVSMCLMGVFAGTAHAADTRPDSVYVILKDTGAASKFFGLVADSGLKEELSDAKNKYTIFAPSNKAMEKLSSDVMKKIKESKTTIRDFVSQHIIKGSVVMYANIKGRRAAPSSMTGRSIGFEGVSDPVLVDGSTLLTTNLEAKNGVVHVLNGAIVGLSFDEAEAAKVRAVQEAQQKKMEAEMKAREAEMAAQQKKEEEKRALMEKKMMEEQAAKAKEATSELPVVEAPAKKETGTATAPSSTEKTEKTESGEKPAWKKMFGF